jgi:endoglucanase
LAAVIGETIAPYCDTVTCDKLGNLIAVVSPKNGKPRARVMLSAHMDEVGFMVKSLESDGRVRIALLGDISTDTLTGRRVIFDSGVIGVVAAKPVHQLGETERVSPISRSALYVELGTTSREETEQILSLGDYGTFEPKFVALRGGLYAGKALGGRACVALLCDMIRTIREKKLDEEMTSEFCFVFSVKREIARDDFGAQAAAFALNPDRAIVLDAISAADFAGVSRERRGASCGKGLTLVPADQKTIYDRAAFADAVECCERCGIPYQYPATASGSQTEAATIHVTKGGIPTLFIGLATRNHRSGAEIVCEKDADAIGELLLHLATKERNGYQVCLFN